MSEITPHTCGGPSLRTAADSLTVASLTLYGLHEVRHHLGDVGA